jgi:hypothetical protein
MADQVPGTPADPVAPITPAPAPIPPASQLATILQTAEKDLEQAIAIAQTIDKFIVEYGPLLSSATSVLGKTGGILAFLQALLAKIPPVQVQ